ncbi:MAG: BRCT domain-containing protein, partial [Planctomycetota bacterium]
QFSGPLEKLLELIEEKKQRRSKLEYPTDGMVLKIDSLKERESLGHTRSSPRFAIALKLEQEEVATIVEAIEIFVGRTGKITPRAKVTPIEIAGTTVTYATLHNEKYIQDLGIGIGATVLVSKRGEIIPAVEKVVFPGPKGIFKFPKNCPSCGSTLVKDPEIADHCCHAPDCGEKKIALLQFFAGRKQMDITGLSDTTIETLYKLGYLKEIPDFYHLKDRQVELIEVKGFGKKSVQLMIEGVEESKKRPFQYVLPSLGLKEIGQNVTELLIQNGYDSIEKIIQLAKSPDLEERFLIDKEIAGIGPKLVEMLRKHFSDTQVITLIETLKKEGLQMNATNTKPAISSEFQGQIWCVTGSFEQFKPREKAMEEIQRRGGKVVGSVSSKTTHLLAGENAGSKQEKAQELGVTIISEAVFLKMIAPPASVTVKNSSSPSKKPEKTKSSRPEKKAGKAKGQKKLFDE